MQDHAFPFAIMGNAYWFTNLADARAEATKIESGYKARAFHVNVTTAHPHRRLPNGKAIVLDVKEASVAEAVTAYDLANPEPVATP